MIAPVPGHCLLLTFILLGKFNARVGTYRKTWEGVIGSEDVGSCNSNVLNILC